MENVKKAIEIMLEQGEEHCKYLLWLLCYVPEVVLKKYGIMEGEITGKELQEKILTACRERYEGFVFASDEPKLDTFGVELRISNPIIRDTIIEHCLEITNEAWNLRGCINDICTSTNVENYEEKRRAGFASLDFSEPEQEFLEKELDRFCIGQFLKDIQGKKYPKKDKYPKKERTIQRSLMSEDVGEYPNSEKLDSASLIENKEIVQQFLWCFNGTSFVNPKLLIENLDKVSILVEKAMLIKSKGIDPTKVGEKADAVGRLYASLECL